MYTTIKYEYMQYETKQYKLLVRVSSHHVVRME